MGVMYFPGEEPETSKKVEKLINRFDGTLTEKYYDEDGKTVEDHHKKGEKTPIISRDIYLGNDRTNRETIFFKDEAGKEKPYLRRVYVDNRLDMEQKLNGSLDKIDSEERYTYRVDEFGLKEAKPDTIARKVYDEEGKRSRLEKIIIKRGE